MHARHRRRSCDVDANDPREGMRRALDETGQRTFELDVRGVTRVTRDLRARIEPWPLGADNGAVMRSGVRAPAHARARTRPRLPGCSPARPEARSVCAAERTAATID